MTMMTSRIAMTAAEVAAGRLMRAPDGHPSGDSGATPAPTPAATPEPTPAPTPTDHFEGMESYEAGEVRNSGDVDPPAPATPNSDDPDAPGGEEGEDGDGKPKGDAQSRIDELTAKAREAERRAAEAERRLQEREAPQPKDEAQPGAESEETEEARPKLEDYANYDDYVRDLAAYEGRVAYRAERERERVESRLNEVETAHRTRLDTAKAEIPDYEDVVIKGADAGTWDCTPLMSLGIKTSEEGPQIAYHLAKNPEESKKIARLSPLEQAKEIGRLEMRFELERRAKAEAAADPTPTPPPPSGKAASDAPPPPPRARGAGGAFVAAADTDDFEAFEKRADTVLQKKAQRT